jgi:hypothetical protein
LIELSPAPLSALSVNAQMQKILLISILVATIAIPVQMSREKSRAIGIKRTIKWMVGFCVFYLFALMYIYPRLEGY